MKTNEERIYENLQRNNLKKVAFRKSDPGGIKPIEVSLLMGSGLHIKYLAVLNQSMKLGNPRLLNSCDLEMSKFLPKKLEI